MLADPLGVLKDLRGKGVLLLGHVAGLFEQRQIHVGFNIALGAGIAVPVPGAAKVAAFFDDPDIGDAGLLQPRRSQQTAKAAADDERVKLLVNGGTGKARLDIRIGVVVLVFAGDFPVLIVTVRAQPFGAFLDVLLAQLGRVKAQLLGRWNSTRLGLLYGFVHGQHSFSIGTPPSDAPV